MSKIPVLVLGHGCVLDGMQTSEQTEFKQNKAFSISDSTQVLKRDYDET
jgi:hypothetical protein